MTTAWSNFSIAPGATGEGVIPKFEEQPRMGLNLRKGIANFKRYYGGVANSAQSKPTASLSALFCQ
jgi:hypothetical protein